MTVKQFLRMKYPNLYVDDSIPNSSITYNKIQNMTANSRVLGSPSTGAGGPPVELVLGANLAMVGNTISATGGGGLAEGVAINAAQDLPAFIFITSSGNIADSGNMAHYNKVVGIITAAVLNGFVATALQEGEVVNPAWTWTPGATLFLNGTSISNVAPTTGFSQTVGVAINPTTIVVKIQVSIAL